MKKTIPLIALLLAATGTRAQKRLVLIEEFTNTGCGPCATWSPVLDSCISYRLGDCIAIKYHSKFPNAKDEFYLAEPADMQARCDYYSVTGVPATFVNGEDLGSRSFEYLSSAISYCQQQQPSDFTLTVARQWEGRELSVHAHATSTPSYVMPANADIRLFVAVVEEHIERATPWPNGETEMNYLMRKIITTASGLPINTDAAVDYEGQWTVDVDADLGQLGVVAFLQDMRSREVLATAYAGPDVVADNCLKLLTLTDTPDQICLSDYHGRVQFRNDGATTVTQATLNVRVNGALKQYPWTGSLRYLERDTMAFEGFRDFPLLATRNEVEVWLSDINGTTTVSNTRATTFANSVQATGGVQLKLYTDKKPEETTWRLYNSAGDVVREGGPYDGQARKFITVDFNLALDDCYQLEFLDAGGDGITGANGNGYYQLFQTDATGKTSLLLQGDYTGASHLVFFHLTDARPTAITLPHTDASHSPTPAYDLLGRPATRHTRLRVNNNHIKTTRR